MENSKVIDQSTSRLSIIWNRFKQEPLLIFAAIAVFIFLGDQMIALTKTDPKAIVITSQLRNDLKQIYANSFKKDPSARDMQILIDRWVDNEVLYREGLALGLDKGDDSIRERVIFKTLSVTQAEVNLPNPDENFLKNWFNEHQEQYNDPTQLNFEEAVVFGKPNPVEIKNFVLALNGKGKSSIDSNLEIFKDRPRFTIVDGYGEEFTKSLEQLPQNEWSALESTAGTRIVRLVRVKQGQKANFEQLKAKIYTDWKNQTAAELSTKAIRELGKKYKIIDQGDKK